MGAVEEPRTCDTRSVPSCLPCRRGPRRPGPPSHEAVGAREVERRDVVDEFERGREAVARGGDVDDVREVDRGEVRGSDEQVDAAGEDLDVPGLGVGEARGPAGRAGDVYAAASRASAPRLSRSCSSSIHASASRALATSTCTSAAFASSSRSRKSSHDRASPGGSFSPA